MSTQVLAYDETLQRSVSINLVKAQQVAVRGSWLKRLFAIAIIVLACASGAAAQQVNGTIAGRVLNEREEVIAGATVTVESTALSIKRTTTTNEEGYFTVPNIPVGLYRVTVKASGFG